MSGVWEEVAKRIVEGAGVRAGELVQIRDRAGRYDVLQEILLAVELSGATPLPEIIPPDYMKRMLIGAAPDYLSRWDLHRQKWMERLDRIIVLQGGELEDEAILDGNIEAWRKATHRLAETEERIGPLPFMLAAIPTEDRATSLGMSLEELEAKVSPALLVGSDELRKTISRVLEAVREGRSMILRSGEDGRSELRLSLGGRGWIPDDGLIDEEDMKHGGVVSNLPAGSIYTTVLETETEGEIHFPRAGAAHDAILRFERGRIVEFSAKSGVDGLEAMFDSHSGEPRRVSHIGIGLNPTLENTLGWTLVDENMAGNIVVAFGENRYMGGENESSLNVDFALSEATLEVDGRMVVDGVAPMD